MMAMNSYSDSRLGLVTFMVAGRNIARFLLLHGDNSLAIVPLGAGRDITGSGLQK